MKSDSALDRLDVGTYSIFRSLQRREEETGKDPESYLELILTNLFGKGPSGMTQARAIITRYASRTSLPPTIAILDSHGYTGNNQTWCYRDQGEGRPVCSWLTQADGRFAALYLHTCNPRGAQTSTKRSIVVYPHMTLGRSLQQEHGLQVSWFVPEFGILHPTDFRLERFLRGDDLRLIKTSQRSSLSY